MAAYAALVSIMHIVDNLELHPHPPISLHKKQLHLLTQKVTFLLQFLEGYNPHLDYSTEADPLESRIADAAYAAEDAIESHILDQITSDGEKISSDTLYEAVEKVLEEMALIEKAAMEIKQTVGVQNQLHRNPTPPNSSISSSVALNSSMVGADDVKLQMMDKLTSHRLHLHIIPIVGMGGTGKTTLARNIYQERFIKEHFYICAWTTFSQEYSIREILLQILSQLIDEDKPVSEEVLGEMLHKHLYGRRYLIIMDDMWNIKAWDEVKRFLPDNKNGSRIVITTRLSNLASKLTGSKSLEMSLLDEADSWELLSKTVFGEKCCPLELEEIGKKIGKSCKGLPLSIVVVGGFLVKSEHTREFWEYIEENLNSIVNSEDDDRCLKILHMSYKQLPVYLKPCFLYMGVFIEDEVIRMSRLAKLWVAEGFLKPVTGKSLEEIAKAYLKDLTDRNLVLIHKMGSTGNIKQCKVHDLLRDLCLREAQKERFYAVVPRTATRQGIVNGQRRIVISSTTSTDEAVYALWSMSQARSLMWNHEHQALPSLNLKLLRILDSYRSQSIIPAKNMHQLVNSRFLAIPLQGGSIFRSLIGRFWNLQTLIYHNPRLLTVSTDIWYMPHIRHVMLPGLHLPDPPNGQYDIVLENLQTLGTIMNFKCGEQVVKRIPNIKKLQICTEALDDRHFLTNLVCLDKLESLSCDFFRKIKPIWPYSSLQRLIKFPHSLKKLTLQIEPSQYWQDVLDMVGVLPLLQKLKLLSGTFKEGKWYTTEGQFRSLKFLLLRYCDGLQLWTTESSHFPCLDHLLLFGIHELKEIPLEFAEISTLRVIDVEYCSDSGVVSAKRILEEQEDLYGEEAALQVHARPLWNNKALESLASSNFCFKN